MQRPQTSLCFNGAEHAARIANKLCSWAAKIGHGFKAASCRELRISGRQSDREKQLQAVAGLAKKAQEWHLAVASWTRTMCMA